MRLAWLVLLRLAMATDNEKSILIVEDEPDGREALSELLQAKGYDVVCAENGKAALDEIATKKPKLILLDLTMPVMDGNAFLDVARRRHLLENVAVIVTTAEPSPSTAGAAAVVKKPIRLERLLSLIGRFIGGR
jgi:CheY-like chemotaxis protein